MAIKKNDSPAKIIRLSQQELDDIIAKHELFCAGKSNGVHAKLSHHDLSGLNLSGHDLSRVDFSGSFLVDTNFAQSKLDFCIFFACDLRKANFRDASMLRVDLRGATMRGATMTGADMTGADMREGEFAVYDAEKGLSFYHEKEGWSKGPGGVDMRGANLDSVKMAGAIAINSNFSDANLTKAKLVRGSLIGVDLTGSNLSGADLSSCEMRDSSLREANLSGALINYSELVNVDLDGALTEAPVGKTHQELTIPLEEMVRQHQIWLKTHGAQGKRMDLSGLDMRGAPSLNGADLTMMVAENTIWYGHDLMHVNLQASQFRGSDLRNCDFSTSDLRGSDFSHAKMVGANFHKVRFEPLLLDNNKMLCTDFSGSALRYVDFSNADVRYVNFSGADLSFTDFTDTNFTNAKFEHADLNDAKIDMSKITPEQLEPKG